MVEIGAKIKALRLENELTQGELADRCELTKGYISQLENNLTTPSIETLNDILEVLGTSLGDFFNDEIEEKVTYHKDEFFEKVNEELGHKISWIVPNSLKFEMEPIIIELEISGQSSIDNPHPGEEFGFVLEGEIVLALGKKKHRVSKGESFYYLANKEHYIYNVGNKKAKVVWISTPPMF